MPHRLVTKSDVVVSGWAFAGSVLAGTLMAWFGVVNAWLFIFVLILMTVEMATEWAGLEDRHGFSLHRNIQGKMMTFALLIVAVIFDRMFIALAPTGFRGNLITYNWITRSTLIWIILGESAMILKHIEQSEGRNAIPPVIVWMMRQFRIIDESRWWGPGKPPRRWTDNLTEQEVAEFMKKFESKQGAEKVEAAKDPQKVVEEEITKEKP